MALNLPQERRFLSALILAVVLLDLLVAAGAWYALAKSRDQYQRKAAITTQNLSRVLDESLTGVLRKIDLVLQGAVDEAEHQLAAGGIKPEALNRFLVRTQGRLPELTSLRVTTPEGDALYGARVTPKTGVNLAHRDYYRKLREDPRAGLVISKPLVGSITGKWMIIFARRINAPNGSFAGLAYAGLSLDRLSAMMSRVDLGPGGLVSFIDRELHLVVRYPDAKSPGAEAGRPVNLPKFVAATRNGRAEGSYRSRSPIDGIERTISFRRLSFPGQTFYVVVGEATRDFLSEWYRELAWAVALVLTFMALSAGLTWLVLKEWALNEKEVRERQRAQEELTLRNSELETTLARTKRLEGMISICMFCKKINTSRESWEELEKYLTQHTDAVFSHGFCPECAQRAIEDLDARET